VTKPLSVAQLTLLDAAPRQLIPMAANAGFNAVGIRLCSPVPGGIEYPMRAGSRELRETKQLLHDHGVSVLDIEVVRIAEDTRIEDYESVFEAGAELSARRVGINVDDPNRARVIDRFGALCDLAAPYGLALDVEFMIWRPVSKLEDALEIVQAVNKSNAFLLVDTLHLIRSGGTVDKLAAVDPKLIGCVQVCDAPLASPDAARIIPEARGNRLLPGDGELPLRELLAVVPADVPLSAEVPLAAVSDLPQRARLVYDATQRLLEALA
jgi:sugar phosphate isomerase/epimerase